ncbi:uncharacterized protein MYCFIDRAFT_174001 [Pseudocercospora fijiensis CIRAD86]|uniref:Uncharacterized protein n=1 Tax=Pseudocercospora fijiensis (strain CIRAD86) TaxID=383855 RepID=M2Z5S5_PSEFD|nr:uncharacterized protein MYCFIDRAFT_174001 [Pseudocercospora fijiensis CIRAD86]EME85155.1 hypothetical protein MYCFIDRAFT_174001 [Pseudocercospora fijiensis CIRAD86]
MCQHEQYRRKATFEAANGSSSASPQRKTRHDMMIPVSTAIHASGPDPLCHHINAPSHPRLPRLPRLITIMHASRGEPHLFWMSDPSRPRNYHRRATSYRQGNVVPAAQQNDEERVHVNSHCCPNDVDHGLLKWTIIQQEVSGVNYCISARTRSDEFRIGNVTGQCTAPHRTIGKKKTTQPICSQTRTPSNPTEMRYDRTQSHACHTRTIGSNFLTRSTPRLPLLNKHTIHIFSHPHGGTYIPTVLHVSYLPALRKCNTRILLESRPYLTYICTSIKVVYVSHLYLPYCTTTFLSHNMYYIRITTPKADQPL